MKLLTIFAASLGLILAGCHRDENSRAAGGTSGSSMTTPKGAATGQKSEGSTDDRNAPARPSSR